MSKKKLLHITSSLKVGGAEAVLCDLIETLDGFEHHVIYFHGGPNVARLEEMRVPVYHIKGVVCLYDPVFFYRLLKTIKKINPTCIHSLLWAANVAGRIVAKFLNIPIVSAYHNNVDQDGMLRNLLDRATIIYADKLVAVSDGVADSMVRVFKNIAASDIQVITNGVDVPKIQEQADQQKKTRAELGFADDDFVVGSVGRFEPVKNQKLLLESFALVRQKCSRARLIVVGGGSLESQLREKADVLGVAQDVRFIIDQPAYGYYPLFDCFVLSSDKEGVSIALLEAMSLSLACVVTNMEEIHPVLEHLENGFVVQAGDAQGLADMCMMLFEDKTIRMTIGDVSAKKVRKAFNLGVMAVCYAKFFENLEKMP